MKLILHIGTEKTGTSSLQQYFYDNRTLFLEKGIYIPASLGEKNHRIIPSLCMGVDKTDKFKKKIELSDPEKRKSFVQEITNEFRNIPKNIHTVIISSEHLHSRLSRQEEIDCVKKLLQPFVDNFQIIVYLRRQIDLLTSLYSTELKVGNTFPDIDSYIQKKCSASNHYYNYEMFLNLWENTFGKENITVKLFDKKTFYENDLILDFSNMVFGTSFQTWKNNVQLPSIENESLMPLAQDYFNLMNQKVQNGSLGEKTYKTLSKVIIATLSGKGHLPSLKTAKQCMENYHKSNANVREKYFPENSKLFSENFSPFEEYKKLDRSQELVMFNKLLEMLNSLYSDHSIDTIRDAALLLENIDLEKSYDLMKIANKLRPDGSLIQKKLQQLEEKNIKLTTNKR